MRPLGTLGRAPRRAPPLRPRRSTCEGAGLARILGADASRPGDPPWLGTGAHVSSVAFPDSRVGERGRRGPPTRGPWSSQSRGGARGGWCEHTRGGVLCGVSTAGGTGGQWEENASPWSGGSKEWVGAGYGVAQDVKVAQSSNLLDRPLPQSRMELPGGSVVKSLSADATDTGLIPGSGRSPQGGNHNPLQGSCLGNPTDRGAWRATIHGVTKESDATERLNKKDGGDAGPQGLHQAELGRSQPAGCPGVSQPPRTWGAVQTQPLAWGWKHPPRALFTGVMVSLQKTTHQQKQGILGRHLSG